MNVATVNMALYRKVKTHTKYDKYFPKTNCKATFLREGTTTDGMRMMKEWALKYQDQTKKIAPQLKSNNTTTTINNIYQFLYDHLQYSADGYDQNLKSPACSWKSRLEGIDCKSYSLFASTILLNLGIPHKFRKVKQPASPERWSHVYVVINTANKDFVIDATKHINTEVIYTEKEDMDVMLPYYGLNGNLNHNNSQNKFIAAIYGLNIYLQKLESKGVSKKTTLEIKNKIRYFLEKNIEPKIEISKDGVLVENTLFKTDKNGLNSSHIGMGSALESFHEINVSNEGIGMGIAISSIISQAPSIIGKFSKLFGDLFNKSSFPPEQAPIWVEDIKGKIFGKANIPTVFNGNNISEIQNAINSVLKDMSLWILERSEGYTDRNSTTIKGIRSAGKLLEAEREQFINSIKQIDEYNVNISNSSFSNTAPFANTSKIFNYTAPQVRLSEKEISKQVKQQIKQKVATAGETVKKAGISKEMVIGTIALASIGAYVVSNQNNNNNKNQK